MKTIKSANDIRFKDFVQVEEKLSNVSNLTSEEVLEVVSTLYEAEIEKVSEMDYNEVLDKLVNVIEAIGKTEMDLVTRFESDGVKYGFIPNFSEITTGELIDLDNLLVEKDFIGIASILYRPIVKESKKGRYTIEEYKGIDRELFENASMRFYMGFINFFYKSLSILNQSSQESTQSEIVK